MGHSIFVTGTDTGVGKTFFTVGIIRVLREIGIDVVGFKPIECGGREDSEKIRVASGETQSIDEVNPVWFDQPLSPMAAADSPKDLNLDGIKAAHQELVEKHELVMVEGAGGWGVPLTPECRIGDLASELSDEVIIVAENRLGALNHVLLTFDAVQTRKMDCARVILNHPPHSGRDSTGYGSALYPAESYSVAGASDLSLSSNGDMIEKCLPMVDVFPLRDESCFPGLVQEFLTESEI